MLNFFSLFLDSSQLLVNFIYASSVLNSLKINKSFKNRTNRTYGFSTEPLKVQSDIYNFSVSIHTDHTILSETVRVFV